MAPINASTEETRAPKIRRGGVPRDPGQKAQTLTPHQHSISGKVQGGREKDKGGMEGSGRGGGRKLYLWGAGGRRPRPDCGGGGRRGQGFARSKSKVAVGRGFFLVLELPQPPQVSTPATSSQSRRRRRRRLRALLSSLGNPLRLRLYYRASWDKHGVASSVSSVSPPIYYSTSYSL